MELEIVNAKSSKPVVTLAAQPSSSTVGDLKRAIGSAKPKYKDVNRQELRQEAKGKPLKDEATLESLGITESTTLYFKDRGTQIAWTTVFMAEYMGPLLVYLLFYIRPWLFLWRHLYSRNQHYHPLSSSCLEFPLRQESPGDHLCPQVLKRYYATRKSVQEL